MKVMFCICSILLFCSFLLAVEAVQIPLGDIQEIASRQAEAYWGKVYSAEPIPYYDRKGDLVVWQFNFSLGKPFPGQEELQQRCRNSASKLWDESWNSEGFANLLMGARTDKPVIISFSKGLSYDYTYLTEMENLAEKHIGKGYKLSRMVHVNMGSRWFVVNDGSREHYIKAFAPPKVVGYEEFLTLTDGLETPLKPMDFSALWQEYFNGRTDTRSEVYLPYPEKMPFYQWVVGCSPCSGSMLSAWWDNMSDVSTKDYSNLIKYHFEAYDDVQEHTDYHITDAVGSIGYYMGTDDEGGTHYYNIDDGMQDFFNSRDYGCWTDSDDLEWEFLWDYDDLFYAARGQINSGKPTLLAIPGHSVAGMGYCTCGHYLLLHDPNSNVIESWYQTEFNMVTYVHPSTSGWGSHVDLISPDGGHGWADNGTGETLYAGLPYEISWTGDFDPGTYVKLWYHLDGGLANPGWTLITASTENDGSYDWAVPSGIASTKCRIRVEVYDSSNVLLGADGSYGNFTIASGTGNIDLVSGIPVPQVTDPDYYAVPDNESSWVVLANQKHNDSPAMGLKLYDSVGLGNLLATSEYTDRVNLIAIDRNHLPDNVYGLKVYNANGMVGGSTEFEGGDQSLINGLNSGMVWGSAEVVKMWDVQLTAGTYLITLDIISGSHNLGMALFSSQSGAYIKNIAQALANTDVNPAGGDESFIVSIPSSDRYGLCVYCKDYILVSGSTHYSITIGTPGLWTGSVNRNWNLTDNWSNHVIPGNSQDVFLPSGCANYPYIFGGITANCRSINIQPGASVEIGSAGTLSVHGGYTDIYGRLKISHTSALAILNGHVNWQTGSVFEETAGGTIRAAGNWHEYNGSTVEINLTQVILDGVESSTIITDDGGNHFYYLTIAKNSGQRVSYSIESVYNLKITGNLVIQSGAEFYGWSSGEILLYGNLTSSGGMKLANGLLRFFSGTTQAVICSSGDFFHDVELYGGTTVNLNSNIYLTGSLHISSGTLNASSYKVTLDGSWTQNVATVSYTGTSTARVKFTGSDDATCTGLSFQVLEIAKADNAEVLIEAIQQVQCVSLDWTSGVIHVNGGSLWVSDLADTRIMGSYILEAGQIDLFQDTDHYVDLDANLDISGGTFNIHGGYNFPSEWAYTQSCQINMSGGILDFKDNGIYLRSTGYYLVANITGGTIRTSGDFKVERNGFNPRGGLLEMYGSSSSTLHVNSPSDLYILKIDKTSREQTPGFNNERINQVTVDSNTSILNYCEVISGILQISSCRLSVGGYMSVYSSLRMDDPTDVLEVFGAFDWKNGSSGVNLTGGSMIHHNNVFLREGSNVQLSAAVSTLLSGATNICVLEPSSSLGSVTLETTSSYCYFSGHNPMNINGDLVIKPNVTLKISSDSEVNVSGKIDIWHLGTVLLSDYGTGSTNNLYNSGQLILDSDFMGDLSVSNTFLQYSNGSLGLHGGSLNLEAPYSGALYAFGGTTAMSGGTLQITNNGMQIGTSGFNFSGGTIKLGWGFQASSPGTFQANNGSMEFIGTLSATVSLGSGNYFSDVTINKTGSSGSVYLGSNVSIKYNLNLNSGKLYVNQYILSVQKDISFNSGYLYGDNANDEIQVGGSWTNNGGTAYFIEGSGLVKFISSVNTKQIKSTESFNNLSLDTNSEYVYVTAGKTIAVAGNLEILSGRFRPLDGTAVNVSGNLNISGASAYLDQNFRRETANTQVHIYGNCIINGGKIYSIDTNGDVPNDILTIDGELNMTGGELNILDLDLTVHGNFSTTAASTLSTRGASFINDAPYTGAWQYVNCPWITYGNIIEFTNKGLQFISGASLDNNSFTEIKLGRGLYATASGVFANDSGTFEFIGTNQANINLGGGNILPAIMINKTGTSIVLSTNAVIGRDLTIQSGNFNSNNYQLTVKGSWTNNIGPSGYSCGTSEVIFNTSNYSKAITGNQTFYKLTFSHTDTTKGIALSNSTSTVSSDLTVNSGRFTIGSSSVLQVNGNVSVANNASLYLQGELKLKGNLTDSNATVSYERGFYAPQSSLLTFNGTANQAFNFSATQINLGGFVLDKSSGNFQPAKGMVCSGDVSVQNGTWGYGVSGLTHYLQGDLLIGSGGNWSDNTGTLVFNGTDNATLSNSGIASFKNLTFDKSVQRITGASVNLTSNLSLSTAGTINVEGGIFNLGGYTLQTNGAVNVNSDAKLSLGAGAILKMASGYTLSVNSGGELSLMGTSTQKAKLTRVSSGNYGLTVASGGFLSANYAIFEYLNTNGINIQSGATVESANSLNNCTFQYGQAGGTLLKIDNAQQFTITNASFPTNAGSGAKNVTKTLNQGTVAFVGETGVFAGSAYENDMYQRINWSTDVPQFVTYQTDFPFGNVPYSQSSTQYMMISNPGSALLVGSIVTPPNFSVALMRTAETLGSQSLPIDKPQYEFSRNILEFSVPIGGSNTYAITFSPTEPIPYAGTIVITHNAASSPANLTVSGNGRGSRIVLDHSFFNIDVQPGQTAHKLLSISNTGVDSLSYSGWVSYSRSSRSTLLSTGFEEGCPPTGWTQQQTLGTQAYWNGSTSTVHPSGTEPYEGSHLGYFNSYTAHAGNRARLESPVIDASDYTGLNLSFWMFHDSGYPTYYDTLQVQVSVNGGAWVDAGFYIMRPTAPYTWREHTIDLSAYDRSSSLRIGFLGKSAYGNDIHIDAINLTGNYQMPTDWITLNGAQSVSGYVWPQDTPATVDIAVDATGLPTGWYYNQLHLLTNDPANPEELVWLYVKIGNPAYSFDPSQLDFGWVEAGQSDSLSLQILNTGQIGLSGTVTVPTGYSIFLGSGPRNREGNRNTLDFYASPGIAAEFTVSFSPTEAIDYNGQLVITSNAGADQYINLIGKGATLPVLTTAAVTNIGVTTATGGGNVSSTGNLPLTERGICWYYMDDPTIDYYHATAPGSTGDFTVNMVNLLPGYNYRVRAYAINALGIAYASQVSFDTPGPSIVATPDTLPDFGAVALGEISAPQTISISGESLAGPVTIDSPQGYQISLQENSGYSMQLELNPENYILAPTTIYVKFSPIERGPWPGALVIQSGGLDNVFVQMTGTGVELPTVETATVVYITTESATVNCRIVDDGGDPVDYSGVVYGLYPDPSIDDNILDLGAQTGWFAAELTNLIANSSYYVRSFAVNVAGLVYGNEVQFNTLSVPQITLDASLLNPFGSIVVGQSSMADTLIVSAQQLTDNLLITAPDGFGLSLNPLGRDFASQLSLVPVTGNISPTMVYVRFAPTVGGNLSDYLVSESSYLQPAQIILNGIGVVAPTLSTGEATDIGSISVTLNGSIDHDGFGAVTACGFCFGTSHNPDLNGSHTLDLVESGDFFVHLDTLQPDTVYFVRSYATNAAGTSYGNEISFQTLLGSLDAPQNLQISYSAGEVQLSWDVVPNANSYYIYRSLDPYSENWGTPFAQTDQTHWEDSETAGMYFYKVSASSEEIRR
jgi:hypothetical protein